jgi:Family of unknown function (DUF6152)
MKALAGLTVVCVTIASTLLPAVAQHTLAAKFDTTKPLTLRGTVTQIEWSNPYAHVLMKVPTSGKLALWAVEIESPILLAKNGWSDTTLNPGDQITVEGFRARSGTNQMSGNTITLASTGKKVLTGYNGTAPARTTPPAAPAPRWPDGHPRLGPTTGQTGYWGNPSATSLVQSGATVAMDAYGLLKNIADVDKVAPMQKWARDVYELRQRTFLSSDPLFLGCKPPGGPRQFQQVYGVQFIEDTEHNRIFVLMGGGNRNERIMYTDSRQQVGQLRGDADNPLYYGRAVARWEGDTLVSDVRGFNEKFWFDNGGLPHTEQLHLIERFTRTDMNTLKYEVSIDDPGAYTKTWTASWTLQWIAGEELPYFLCQDNRP